MFQIFIAQLRYQDYRIHRQSLWIYIQMFLKSHKLFIALECIVNISDIEIIISKLYHIVMLLRK